MPVGTAIDPAIVRACARVSGIPSGAEFFRYPHTPHLAWLGGTPPRADKVLTPAEASNQLAGPVVLEEKVDGANLGFSLDEGANLRVQNRGSYLSTTDLPGQFRSLSAWLAPRSDALTEALFPDLMVFGEWCYAVHSVRYMTLPDWFLAFDVYDRAEGRFWSCERRDVLARRLGLSVVPRIGMGMRTLDQIVADLGESTFTPDPMEGIYVRRDDDQWNVARAKVVRPEFVQAIGPHWSSRRLEANRRMP